MIYIKIIYPDNEIEFFPFTSKSYSEITRLQKIHNNKLKYKIITK